MNPRPAMDANGRDKYVPPLALTQAAEAFVQKYTNEVPSWVLRFAGPFRDLGVEGTMKEYLNDSVTVNWQRWAERYLINGLGTMVIVSLYFINELPTCDFLLVLSRPHEILRFGQFHVSKDAQLSPFVSKHVVNTPDVAMWRQQRRHFMDAFLPLGPLTAAVPKLISMADVVCTKWLGSVSKGGHAVVDVRSWMHHTALAMFINCMMGDDRAFGKSSAVSTHRVAGYGDSLDFAETTPSNSVTPRSVLNLEGIGRSMTTAEQEVRFTTILGFTDKLFKRAEERKEKGHIVGPLMERLMELEDPEVKFQNAIATLIAGHDTTAFTMQFCLMELARHPDIQMRVRKEAIAVFSEIKNKKRSLSYSDLPKFSFMTKCIYETLRLWNVAATVFPRVTSSKEDIEGSDGKMVRIPNNTKFTFWYYGQHHSKQLWGDDVMAFNPDRSWHPAELQISQNTSNPFQGTAMTPSTERFHPFSVPSRDCLGKNFALAEMRILLPAIVAAFHVEIPEDSELKHVQPTWRNSVYSSWSRNIGGPTQPHALYLKITPVNRPSCL